jgi:hypothetical protein
VTFLMDIVTTIVAWTATLLSLIGPFGVLLLFGFLLLVRFGGKAIAPWAKNVRDLTIAGAAFAGLLRLTLGPAWRRYVVGVVLAGGWWLTWRRIPDVRWWLFVSVTLGLVVLFLSLSAGMAKKHNLRDMPPLAALLEGYRREQTKAAVSGAVKAGTNRKDDEHRIVRRIHVLADRIVAEIEPHPGQSVAEIAIACEAGKVGPAVTRAMRAQGMPVPAHAVEAKVTGEHEGAALVEISTVPPRQRLDLTAQSFAWPGPVTR